MSSGARENRKEYEPFASTCVHGKPPACSVACPLNLDVREIVRHIQRGSFASAYRAYRVKAVFPEIVAEICDEPCKGACVRAGLDESISLRLLEKACVEFARTKDIPRFNLPRRPERIAVIGGGLSGLTCAVKSAAKNHPVTIYEKSERLGGRLWDLLDPEIFLPSLESQLQAAGCELRFGTEVTSLDELESDVVVVATGEDGEAFGLLEGSDLQSYGTKRPGVFLIGNLRGTTPVEDIARGRVAAFSVEKYLKVGAMDGIAETFPETGCAFEIDLSGVESRPAVAPEGAGAYSQKQAQAEAGRCLLCDCNVCSEACELFAAVHKMPKQMVADAMGSLHTSTKSGGTIKAMSSCNLCGLCGKICPQGIDMGTFYSDFRVFKHEDGLVPLAFHEFFMNDMGHANEEAYLARTALGHDRASHVFFPGCQLAASDPRHVELTYHHLLGRMPDTGLILGCCGAPAEWAAETRLRDEVAERLKNEWERFGRPTFVFACCTCRLQFERHLPEIPGVSLYALLLDVGLPEVGGLKRDVSRPAAGERGAAGEPDACVFDPCSSRHDESAQRAVRRIAESAGITLRELPYSGEKAQCCGYGGHIGAANPKLAATIARDRASAGPLPYITYCANCQEVFSRGGKPSRHVLDIVFGLDRTVDHLPSLGERRANRMLVKRAVLEREWGLDMGDAGDEAPRGLGTVEISEELLATMYAERILEEDVHRTIEYCESTGNAVYDPQRDLFIGHLRRGATTFWVEYAKSDARYVLNSVYSHRVEIIER